MICFHSLNYWYLHQPQKEFGTICVVVICFHSLNYWYLHQQTDLVYNEIDSCDLLSFFELLIFTPAWSQRIYMGKPLWFAFILWTTDIYTSTLPWISWPHIVVICFHSLNYWYLHQRFFIVYTSPFCCDLLSFFELLIFTPAEGRFWTFPGWLWFAFILWTTDIYTSNILLPLRLSPVVICFHSLNYWYLHQLCWNISIRRIVVICFHSLNYWYLHQLSKGEETIKNSCDLLSFFELLIFTPAKLHNN